VSEWEVKWKGCAGICQFRAMLQVSVWSVGSSEEASELAWEMEGTSEPSWEVREVWGVKEEQGISEWDILSVDEIR